MVNTRFIKLLSIFICIILASCSTVSESDADSPTPVVDRSVNTVPVKPSQQEQKLESPSVQPDLTYTPEPVEKESYPEPEIDNKTTENPAVVALLENVDTYEASGNTQQAEATLERAIRIDPKNSVLWHRLGSIRLHEKKWQQAIAMAQKSNSLAADNTDIQLANWKIILQASKANGNIDLQKHAQNMIKKFGK